MDLLKIEEATFFRGSTKVFENFSLAIRPGESTAIVGPNGAGKSTLLKVISREIYPARGRVTICGKSQWNVWQLRKRLGIVSNDLQRTFRNEVSGRDVLLSGHFSSQGLYDHHALTPDQIQASEQIAEQLGIRDFFDKPFNEMSTGEQRRHLLGRALVHRPEALILDEPTSGLDIPATFRYLQTIQNLIRRGKTIVLVTHHVDEIPPEIQRIVLIKRGRILRDGPKSHLLSGEILSELFDHPISVVESNGFYRVVPVR